MFMSVKLIKEELSEVISYGHRYEEFIVVF